MACLWCQKQFLDHTLTEIVFCIDWIQTQHGIRSDQYSKTLEVDGS